MKTQKLQIALISIILATLAIVPITNAHSYINLNDISITNSNGDEIIKTVGPIGSTFEKTIIITNHSNTEKSLQIKVEDAEMVNHQYQISKSAYQHSLKSSITLDNKELILNAKESISIPIKIHYPENIGIGTHLGGILISHKKESSNGYPINIEKGIRIEAEVTGIKDSKYKIINNIFRETDTDKNIYESTIVNSGNTNLKGEISIINQAIEGSNATKQIIALSPGEDKKIKLNIDKVAVGPERVVAKFTLNESTQTFLLSDKFVLPPYIPAIFVILSIIFGAVLIKRKSKFISSLLLISIISATITFSNQGFVKLALFTDTLLNQDTAYLTTIKWGNFGNTTPPDWVITNWVGQFKSTTGKIYLIEKLHNENNDHITINSTKDTLSFKNTTGPDNDGVILLIKIPKGETGGILTLNNFLTGEEINIQLDKTLNNPKYFNYKQQQIEIQSILAPKLIKTIQPNGEIEIPLTKFSTDETSLVPSITEIESTLDNTLLINDLEGTPDQTSTTIEDLEATFDQKKLLGEISLLKEIIEDIPASPDILSEIILNSTFVDNITSENNSTTVKSSSRLIDTLKNTPLTIQEITATPDQNFIFLPNENVKLTPQTFSFGETKISSQELDEIVFVQKKGNPWNVFFSITDFYSVAGNHTIDASNVTVTPGAINLINQEGTLPLLEAGTPHKITDSTDQAVLISIIPLDEGETTFSIKPRINISVPPNTPPGLYKAEITIRAI